MDIKPIDADNHYYESLDAFTRHLDKKFKWRGVHPVQDGKRVQILVGGKVNRFIPNPTFDPIIVPGCLDAFFRGQVPDGVDPTKLAQVEPLRPEYQDRDKRVAVLESQGLEAAILFPTLGCGIEHALKDDVEATMGTLHAFNRWLEEDWGFDYRGKLIAAPMLSLADPDAACEEVDSLLKRGARVIHVRPAPVPGADGKNRSLGDKRHDPVWARIAEASVPVAFHLGDSGYNLFAAEWGGAAEFEAFAKVDVLARIVVSDRAIHDTIASMVIHKVFKRHPGLRVASVENGSDFLHVLVKRLRKQANQTPWAFVEDPLDTIRKHVWVVPYCEEDFGALAKLMGTERILFGSDWPHGEGLAQPRQFLDELGGFDDGAVRRIMHDNVLELLGAGA
jgi:predicted TIM-barrel fold metal-dependent hydrolase